MLKIFHNSTDYSEKLENYIDQTQAITLLDTDYLYVGYKKPINALYVAMSTVSTGTRTVDIEYYNGSTFTAAEDKEDKTLGLTRNGWLKWIRNQITEAVTTINSLELFWYRISVSTSTSAVTYLAINLLFSDDIMIKECEPHLLDTDFYPTGYTSFIPFHQAARSEIIQRLRNEGRGVYDGTQFSDLNIFDLLDFTQLGEASKFYALAQIYFNLSDSPEDKYWQKYEDYMKRYNNAYRVFFLSIDENDDGLQSIDEKEAFKSGLIIRV